MKSESFDHLKGGNHISGARAREILVKPDERQFFIRGAAKEPTFDVSFFIWFSIR